MAPKKKRRKPLRGVIPGSSKFARLTSRVASSSGKQPPSDGISDGLELPPCSSELAPDSTPPIAVAPGLVLAADLASGPPSGDTISSPLRKFSAMAHDPSCLEEIGCPTQYVSGAPLVFFPDVNIQAAKEEFKDFVFAHQSLFCRSEVILFRYGDHQIYPHRGRDITDLLQLLFSCHRDKSLRISDTLRHPIAATPTLSLFDPTWLTLITSSFKERVSSGSATKFLLTVITTIDGPFSAFMAEDWCLWKLSLSPPFHRLTRILVRIVLASCLLHLGETLSTVQPPSLTSEFCRRSVSAMTKLGQQSIELGNLRANRVWAWPIYVFIRVCLGLENCMGFKPVWSAKIKMIFVWFIIFWTWIFFFLKSKCIIRKITFSSFF
ncbi:predicted protein [Arabidopsis lyrata subsp. lyrata]|uniref:Predicted protein n=1 Tax=Arabidopsis lyrata subsp. lyrata TaxID=81972 RepID=D7MH39_ARALL|nr:predicted protein [Arabidopsis lyrata subsp. lyrata]